MSTTTTPTTPQGNVPALGVPNTQDYGRLVFTSPYFETIPIAEIIQPSVLEAVEGLLPSLLPQYVQDAANAAVAQQAVLLAGSTMTGALYLNPVMPVQPSQAASMAYVDALVATAGVPEVPAVPIGQSWLRQTGQWVPAVEAEGTFLPLGGGTMQGQINMSGNSITNLAALPVMPNGAAPAQWVLNQIAAQSLFQGTWTPDTNTPDLTQPGTHQNGFTWIVTTSTVGGVVVSEPIPGLQGQTVFNGDTVIYSAIAGQFQIIHGGGLSLEEAQALFLPLAGGQMSGALLLNANASQPMQAVTLQQLQAFTPPGEVPEAPADGQVYGRVGVGGGNWITVLPLAGGILTGALTLAANAATALQPVPLQQLNSSLASYVPLSGNVTVTGPLTMGSAATLTLNANAATALQAVPLQQLTATLGSYLTSAQAAATYLALAGGTMTGALTLAAPASAALQPAAYEQVSGLIPQNYADNSGFTVNQRAYVSGTALAAAAYGFDRWKAGASGATLTFTASPASTTVTITAGSLQQVIEGLNMLGAAYTLSWVGTATGRIATTSGGGTYAASPIQFTATANTNTYIEFTGGTLGRVQLQLGTVATPWQPQPFEMEMARCQRFYQWGGIFQTGTGSAGQLIGASTSLLVQMRVQPTLGVVSWPNTNLNNVAMGTVTGAEPMCMTATGDIVSTGGYTLVINFSASAEL